MIFTPEELLYESRPPSAQAEAALRAGRLDQARYLLGLMSSGHLDLFWGYLHWITRLAGKIHRDFGEAYFESVASRIAGFLVSPYVQLIIEGREKQAISEIIFLWSCQKGRVEPVEETPNEVAFHLGPCGSGGRLILEACYEKDPRVYPRTDRGTPLFCRICEHLQHALNQSVGKTFWSVVPDPNLMGFCRMSFLKQAARGSRLYAEGELRRLLTPRCSRALLELDRGNLEIGDLLKDQHREWRPLHDLLCLFVTSLLSLVYEEKGVPYLTQLVWESYVTLFEGAYKMHAVLDDRTVFKSMVRTWHYHQATFQVREEADRFVFTLDPCGSGGRLLRAEMVPPGFFRYGRGLLGMMQEGADLTFQRAPFPVYCTHCAATNKDQLLGKPWPFLVDGGTHLTPGSPCIQFLYKKTAPRRVPAELLHQVGLDSVEPLRKEYLT